MKQFSVLMSLYFKEKPEYFRQCMKSIVSQTLLPNEIVIVKDGPLTDELEKVLSDYVKIRPDWYKIVPLEENVGLGLALAEGIQHCSYDIIARMDTDDLAVKERFEIQIKEFVNNPDLDICGSNIVEFEDDPHHIVSKRIVPLNNESIYEYQRRRDAFNHMTVMFKKEAVIKAGNYQSCMLMEDTLLWVNMMLNGAVCKNIEKPLVYARIGKEMFQRRGGMDYFKKYKSGRKRIYETGYISRCDYYYTLLVQLIVALIPRKIRGLVFKNLLHRG